MATISPQTGNSAKRYEELNSEQKERVLNMFAQMRPMTSYLYEIDINGDVRCRRYIADEKPASLFEL